METMEVHICPVRMRTVAFENGECLEICIEDACPVREALKSRDSVED